MAPSNKEFYRALRCEVFLGIPRYTVESILGVAGVLDKYIDLLDINSLAEPLHVGLIDSGITKEEDAPVIIALDISSVQIDAGLNEIPKATCLMNVGRDVDHLQKGVSNLQSMAILHLLERYINQQQIPAKIYGKFTQTSAGGFQDLGDNIDWTGEWVVLFDGLMTAPSRRGSNEAYSFVVHMTHFTSVLTYSSSLSSNIVAGTDVSSGAYQPLFKLSFRTNLPGQFTPYGAVAATLARGSALFTDFWGYNIPAEGKKPYSAGLKGFLTNLGTSASDITYWPAIRLATQREGRICEDANTLKRSNSEALEALRRIEPFWELNNLDYAESTVAWKAIRNLLDTKRQEITNGRAIDRSDISGSEYYDLVGYRYGVPIAFWLSGAYFSGLGNNLPTIKTPARGFAHDIAYATWNSLAPSSFWDLLVNYATRYQIAYAPMSDRGVMIPFQPFLDDVWTTIYASELFSWQDDVANPPAIRGVVLTGERKSFTNMYQSGTNPGTPGAAQGIAQMDAAYDTCQPGMFIFRNMPAWLIETSRSPAAFMPNTVKNSPKNTAAAPWTIGNLAKEAVSKTLNSNDPTLNNAPSVPTDDLKSTAYRLAKSLYQQARTQGRSLYISMRFRYDIAPGSIVKVEIPSDKYIREALGTKDRDTVMSGMVLRMSLSIDCEQNTASTSLQIGYCRFEGEMKEGNPLFSRSHPFWLTACYGVPWCDSLKIRQRLGKRANLNGSIFRFT